MRLALRSRGSRDSKTKQDERRDTRRDTRYGLRWTTDDANIIWSYKIKIDGDILSPTYRGNGLSSVSLERVLVVVHLAVC